MRWWQIRNRNADLERELRSDLELEEEEQRERGVPSEEAVYAARRAFGNFSSSASRRMKPGACSQSSASFRTSSTPCARHVERLCSPL